MRLTDSVEDINGIGTKKALLLSKASVFCVNDLLHYFPRDYRALPSLKSLAQVSDKEDCLIFATVVTKPSNVFRNNKNITSFKIKCNELVASVAYYNQPFRKNEFVVGAQYYFHGKLSKKYGYKMDQPEAMTEQEYQLKKDQIIPVYTKIDGIKPNEHIKFIRQALDCVNGINDYLPEDILDKYNLMPIRDAFRYIHMPDDIYQAENARKRLAFDEMFSFMVKINRLKEGFTKVKSHVSIGKDVSINDFLDKLPFALTKGQQSALKDVLDDLNSGYVMNRLIEGDVGCGKTALAFAAAYMVVASGYQAVIMAPTGVLAYQHYEEIVLLTKSHSLPFRPCFLAGSLSAKEKRLVKDKIKDGSYNLVIGTHAILEEDVEFDNLALAITDEQHRFGVRQRTILSGKSDSVHVIVMSATPIPRTLAIILYGDLDISLIKEKPAMRKPIKNAVVDTSYHGKILDFIRQRHLEGRQVYVICSMAKMTDEDSALSKLKNAEDYSVELQKELGMDIRVAYLHGKLKDKEKDKIMAAFKKHEIDVLVSTTVIEVGVNVPNATAMIVENAERFGLAQLHQLRGRVGRGDQQSYCIFVLDSDSKKSKERLEILKNENDGFKIAQKDLALRGPGDFWGYRQSGEALFTIADIYDDADQLKNASMAIKELDKRGISFMGDSYDEEDYFSLKCFHRICL